MNFYANLKNRAVKLGEYYETGDEKTLAEVEKYSDFILSLMKPKDMNEDAPNAYINEFEVSFERMCHSMQSNYPGRSIKELSVQEFYSLVDLLEDKNKKRK